MTWRQYGVRFWIRAGIAAVAVVTLWGCEEVGPTAFEEPMTLGGRQYQASTLNQGRDVYLSRCHACHGPLGDGKGPMGIHQKPPARDLRLGLIKFSSVGNALPSDDDLKRVITKGLKGTMMIPADVQGPELDALLGYIKTFSPRWQTEVAPKPAPIPPDPWAKRIDGGIVVGEKLFSKKFQCNACHHNAAGNSDRKWVDSSYGKLRAPNLARDALRGGQQLEDLYRVISAGVTGTPMAGWADRAEPKEIWAVAHYVLSLRPKTF